MAKRFGVMLDMSRNAVMKPEQVKRFAAIIKKMGYNMIQLYTEDTYEIPEEPYFGYLRGRYSMAELKDIVAYCNSIGVEIIPCIQTLAHLNTIFRWEPFGNAHDTADILLVDEDRTYELIERMFASARECFTTDCIHIGMDEAHNIGLGKFLEKHGLQNRFDILHRHLERVIAIAEKYNFKPIMWSDMFFRLANKGGYYLNDTELVTDEVINACPKGVDLVYWDYYRNSKRLFDIMFDAHAKFGRETWFAGGVWTWQGFAPDNSWSIESMAPAMQSCTDKGIENIIMTMWGDNGKECSFYSVLPSLFAIRKFYDGITDMDVIKQEFESIMGEPYDALMLLDIPIDFGTARKTDGSPNKYLLYSDPFLSFLDVLEFGDLKTQYLDLASKLEQAANTSNYGYLFESQAALCRVLAIKYNLGIRTRTAYKSGNKQELQDILLDFDSAIKALEEFISKFRKLWHTENKPHGLEVQEIRLGGLLMRLQTCRERLSLYLSGEISELPELAEEILPYASRGYRQGSGNPNFNNWSRAASPNII